MKAVKLTQQQAEVLVTAWQKFGLSGAIKHAMPEGLSIVPESVPVRVLVGRMNKTASDYLFDGHVESAILCLLKYGLNVHANGCPLLVIGISKTLYVED